MRNIALTKGQFAIVDDADHDWLSEFNWYAQESYAGFYAARRLSRSMGRKLLYMHREILRPLGGMVADHVNGNGLDNRRLNLRPATSSQNNQNRRRKELGSSRFKGVCLDDKGGNKVPWKANITVSGRRLYLGRFQTEEEAGLAYAKASALHFGEFHKS